MNGICALALLALFVSCGGQWQVPSYQVVLPPVPESWNALLGEPDWRLEWINPEGARENCLVRGYAAPRIQVLETWATPVSAYPFWDNAPAETMKGAGGIFPFDASGGLLCLSWQGGVEAALYRELARAGGGEAAGTPRYPQYFNWPRFREVLAERQGEDLWLVDWQGLAEKTARSGFDRRRVAAAAREPFDLPIEHEGFWISASPFAKPLYQSSGAALTLNLCGLVETYLSSAGILRCSKAAWVITPCGGFTCFLR
ncbi:MAG: hypothetical protein LBD13_07170 [Spirochaetaceae bacterium]|jgi:hypothetical protein|nr:hypothetical protein [Spirochaetaceae bacterium]